MRAPPSPRAQGVVCRRTFVSALAAAAAAGCAGGHDRTPDELIAADVAATQRGLAGAWVLESFMPTQPLEPIYRALLTAQFGVLVLRFDAGRLRATGPGIEAQRAYDVVRAYGPRFALRVRDETGVGYDGFGVFETSDRVTFESMTSPWTGRGSLRRVTQ